MHQHLFLFTILLNCLLIESKILVNTLPTQNLEFHYSPRQSQSSIVRVATRLVFSNGVKSFYSLHGDLINDTMLIVETVHYNSSSSSPTNYASNYKNIFIFI